MTSKSPLRKTLLLAAAGLCLGAPCGCRWVLPFADPPADGGDGDAGSDASDGDVDGNGDGDADAATDADLDGEVDGGDQDGDLPPGTVAGMALGQEHSCAWTRSGEAYCWGGNRQGQLGNGTTEERHEPDRVAGLEDVVGMSAAYGHSCAWTREGEAFCWGWNDFGELGDGTLVSRLEPARVTGIGPVRGVAAGGADGWQLDFTCAWLEDGTAACWGRNLQGQLGLGHTEDRVVPTPLDLEGVAGIATGHTHACAWLDDGTARCWGSNGQGQLGLGDTDSRLGPERVSGLEDVVHMATAEQHTCAVRRDGAVFCFGRNTQGQLGDGTTDQALVPVRAVDVESATTVAAGGEALWGSHSCAVENGLGRAFCWGANFHGQLGDATSTARPTATAVATVDSVLGISTGRYHSCAWARDGRAWCWGLNGSGQLGIGTTETHYAPEPLGL